MIAVNPSSAKRRYLIVGPAWVGDMVMAQSLFKALRAQYPDCDIDVVAPGWSKPIIERMPEVRRAIEMPLGHGALGLKTRRALGKSLRGEQYSHAIVTPRSFKSALVPFFAKVPVRTGFLGEQRYGLLNDRRKLDKSVLEQTVQRYVSLAFPTTNGVPDVPFPQLTINSEQQRKVLERLSLNLSKPVVALLPGAEFGPAKQWPAEHFAALARELVADGYSCWIMGSEKERELGEQIVSKGVHNLCGKTALADVVDLLAATSHVVSNDSGLMHVAAAVGVPVTGIYGSSSPKMTPPLSTKATVLSSDISCSPCFARTCQFGHTDCLVKQAPMTVLATIDRQGRR